MPRCNPLVFCSSFPSFLYPSVASLVFLSSSFLPQVIRVPTFLLYPYVRPMPPSRTRWQHYFFLFPPPFLFKFIFRLNFIFTFSLRCVLLRIFQSLSPIFRFTVLLPNRFLIQCLFCLFVCLNPRQRMSIMPSPSLLTFLFLLHLSPCSLFIHLFSFFPPSPSLSPVLPPDNPLSVQHPKKSISA